MEYKDMMISEANDRVLKYLDQGLLIVIFIMSQGYFSYQLWPLATFQNFLAFLVHFLSFLYPSSFEFVLLSSTSTSLSLSPYNFLSSLDYLIKILKQKILLEGKSCLAQTRWFSGHTLGSVFRDHFWRGENCMQYQGSNRVQLYVRQVPYLVCAISLA